KRIQNHGGDWFGGRAGAALSPAGSLGGDDRPHANVWGAVGFACRQVLLAGDSVSTSARSACEVLLAFDDPHPPGPTVRTATALAGPCQNGAAWDFAREGGEVRAWIGFGRQPPDRAGVAGSV